MFVLLLLVAGGWVGVGGKVTPKTAFTFDRLILAISHPVKREGRVL